jgi:hypothetical protein
MVSNRHLLIAVLAIGSLGTANASVILVSPTPFSGTGLGAVNTVLTMTSPGSSTTESGCVGFSAAGDVLGSAACAGTITGGNELTGASQTLTRTIAQSGATSASDFRIVFNAVEPGANSITLDSLAVRFFSPTGTVLYTASTAAPITFPSTFTGMGNAGFVFSLDTPQAAAATAAGAFSSLNNRIGLSASASNATGGPESFFVTSSTVTGGGGGGGGAGGAIPEPATYVLLGAGLVAFGIRSRMASV